MEKYLIFFVLLILPFIVFPLGVSSYEVIKVILFQIALVILITYSAITKKVNPKNIPQKLAVPLALLTLLIGYHLVQYPTQLTWWGNPYRLQGAITILTLFLWAISIAALNECIHLGRKKVLFALVALALTALIFGNNSARRAIGTLGEPNALAAYAIFLWPLALDISKKKMNTLNVSALIFPVVIIFLTISKSALIAFALQILFVLAATYLKKGYTSIVTICIVLVLATHICAFIEGDRIWESREEIWHTAVTAGFYQPLIGNGVGNMETVFMMSAAELRNAVRYQYVDSSHNIYLDWWVQYGVIGLGIVIYVLYQTFKKLIDQKNTIMITTLIGVLVTLQFNPASITLLIAFWWIIGQALNDKSYHPQS